MDCSLVDCMNWWNEGFIKAGNGDNNRGGSWNGLEGLRMRGGLMSVGIGIFNLLI